MQGSLFRNEAVEHQQDRLHGTVLVVPSVSHSLIVVVLLLWISALVVWLVTSQYSRKETVSGWLEPSQGMVRVFAESGQGRIKQVLVKEGEQVVSGQPLVIVNGDRVLADGRHLETQLLNEYEGQRTILRQQLERLDTIYSLRVKDSEQQLQASQNDLAQLQAQIATVTKRYQLVRQKSLDYQSMLEKGHVSAVEVQAVVEQQLALQSQIQGLERDKVNQQNRIEQLQTRLALLPNEQKDRVDELNKSLSDLAQRIAQLHGQRAYVIKASVDGQVTSLQARVGQSVQLDKPLLTLLPQGSQLLANLLVPVRAAGFLEAGQSLDIRYDAFPYQKFGLYKGQIDSVSESVLLPNEISQSLVVVQEPVYLVRARLESETVKAYGQQMPLKVGMSLSADIRLKERSLLEWLLEPIYSLRGRV